MPQFYDKISPELTEWMGKQAVFWTGTAPLVGKHINVSPKGLPSSSFSILSPNQAAYIDFTGSGSETISHLYENKRITILFNSFGSSPKILRLFCNGRVVEAESEGGDGSVNPEFAELVGKMGKNMPVGARAVILLDVWKVQTSCGYGVPVLTVKDGEEGGDGEDGEGDGEGVAGFVERDTLKKWAGNKVEKGEMGGYQVVWNSKSLDGLPGLRAARRRGGERWLWWGGLRTWVGRVVGRWDSVGVGLVGGAVVGLVVGRKWRW